jgi:hypothetical protein
VENRGFWALEAPPKREKQMNTRGPIYRLAGHWSAFERRVHVRLQIIAVAARADWACVRPQIPCVRMQITTRAGWACM